MKVLWLSAGVSSFVAGFLEREDIDKAIYIHVEDQHSDSLRFIRDFENKIGLKVEILQSPLKNVDNVIKTRKYINGAYGAQCTKILKKDVRKAWEKKNPGTHTYVWGYDYKEVHRAKRIKNELQDCIHCFPLINHCMTKQESHVILKTEIGVSRPIMYELGYPNNNCIGCVKGGMGYWNKIRIDFPDVFKCRAQREREIGHTCLRQVVNRQKIPLFLDELEPTRGGQL